MKIRPALRFLSCALSINYFATNCAFAHAAELTIWDERSVILRRPQADVIASERSERSNLMHLKKEIASSSASGVLLAMTRFGSVRKILEPKSPSSKSQIIIHIQDIHRNPEAQTNISRALQEILKTNPESTVALEGASGPINLSTFQNYSDKQSLRMVADYLLRTGEMSGAIHALLSGSSNPMGIDDALHYHANVAAYRAAAPQQQTLKKDLSAATAKLDSEKEFTFNAELLAFDRQVNRFEKNEIKLGEFATTLAADSKNIPTHVQDFLRALKAESALNFKQIEKDRTAGQYTPAVAAYVDYVMLSKKLDIEKILEEIGQMEKETYAALTKTAQEKNLIQESRRLHLMGKLADFALTKEEWKEYSSLPQSFSGSLYQKNRDTTSSFIKSGCSVTNVSAFKSFYREAEIRDEKMAENFLRHISSLPQSFSGSLYQKSRDPGLKIAGMTNPAILVTGGFHTAGIDQRLVDAGYTVVQFVPKISKVDSESGSSYLSVFSQEKTPLAQLFDGDKLFLAENPKNVLAPLAVATAAMSDKPTPSAQELLGTPDLDLSVNRSHNRINAVLRRASKVTVVSLHILLGPGGIDRIVWQKFGVVPSAKLRALAMAGTAFQMALLGALSLTADWRITGATILILLALQSVLAGPRLLLRIPWTLSVLGLYWAATTHAGIGWGVIFLAWAFHAMANYFHLYMFLPPESERRLIGQEVRHILDMAAAPLEYREDVAQLIERHVVWSRTRFGTVLRLTDETYAPLYYLLGLPTVIVLSLFGQGILFLLFPSLLFFVSSLVGISSAYTKASAIWDNSMNRIVLWESEMNDERDKRSIYFHELTHAVFEQVGEETMFAASFMDKVREDEISTIRLPRARRNKIKLALATKSLDQIDHEIKELSVLKKARDEKINEFNEPKYSYPYGRWLAVHILQKLKGDPHMYRKAYRMGILMARGVSFEQAFEQVNREPLDSNLLPDRWRPKKTKHSAVFNFFKSHIIRKGKLPIFLAAASLLGSAWYSSSDTHAAPPATTSGETRGIPTDPIGIAKSFPTASVFERPVFIDRLLKLDTNRKSLTTDELKAIYKTFGLALDHPEYLSPKQRQSIAWHLSSVTGRGWSEAMMARMKIEPTLFKRHPADRIRPADAAFVEKFCRADISHRSVWLGELLLRAKEAGGIERMGSGAAEAVLDVLEADPWEKENPAVKIPLNVRLLAHHLILDFLWRSIEVEPGERRAAKEVYLRFGRDQNAISAYDGPAYYRAMLPPLEKYIQARRGAARGTKEESELALAFEFFRSGYHRFGRSGWKIPVHILNDPTASDSATLEAAVTMWKAPTSSLRDVEPWFPFFNYSFGPADPTRENMKRLFDYQRSAGELIVQAARDENLSLRTRIKLLFVARFNLGCVVPHPASNMVAGTMEIPELVAAVSKSLDIVIDALLNSEESSPFIAGRILTATPLPNLNQTERIKLRKQFLEAAKVHIPSRIANGTETERSNAIDRLKQILRAGAHLGLLTGEDILDVKSAMEAKGIQIPLYDAPKTLTSPDDDKDEETFFPRAPRRVENIDGASIQVRNLTLPLTRWIANCMGLDPHGAFTEIWFASHVEFLLHWIPFFPLIHYWLDKNSYSHHQWLGLIMIWGFMLPIAFAIPNPFESFWWWIVVIETGNLGHATYNALARTEWGKQKNIRPLVLDRPLRYEHGVVVWNYELDPRDLSSVRRTLAKVERVGSESTLPKTSRGILQKALGADNTPSDLRLRVRNRIHLGDQGVIALLARRAADGDADIYNELLSAAQIGFIESFKKFDWRRGFDFKTIAKFGIRREMEKILRSRPTLRIAIRTDGALGTIAEDSIPAPETYSENAEANMHELLGLMSNLSPLHQVLTLLANNIGTLTPGRTILELATMFCLRPGYIERHLFTAKRAMIQGQPMKNAAPPSVDQSDVFLAEIIGLHPDHGAFRRLVGVPRKKLEGRFQQMIAGLDVPFRSVHAHLSVPIETVRMYPALLLVQPKDFFAARARTIDRNGIGRTNIDRGLSHSFVDEDGEFDYAPFGVRGPLARTGWEAQIGFPIRNRGSLVRYRPPYFPAEALNRLMPHHRIVADGWFGTGLTGVMNYENLRRALVRHGLASFRYVRHSQENLMPLVRAVTRILVSTTDDVQQDINRDRARPTMSIISGRFPALLAPFWETELFLTVPYYFLPAELAWIVAVPFFVLLHYRRAILRGDKISPRELLLRLALAQIFAIAFQEGGEDWAEGIHFAWNIFSASLLKKIGLMSIVGSDCNFVRDNQQRLEELKPEHAFILKARFIEGKSQQQIADERGVSQPAITKMQRRALARLRELVSPDPTSDLAFVREHQDRLNELSDDHSFILNARFIEGKTLQRIADERGVAQSSIRSMQKTALARLRELVLSGEKSDLAFVREHQDRLNELSPNHAFILRARFIELKTLKQIAKEKDLTQPTIADMLRTALKRLRKLVISGEKSDLALVREHQHRLNELSADHAAILKARFLEGKTLQHIADERGVGSSSIFYMQKTALARLRELVSPDPNSDRAFVREHQDRLTLDLTRWLARQIGLDPYGELTETVLAPIVESPLHWLPYFPLLHAFSYFWNAINPFRKASQRSKFFSKSSPMIPSSLLSKGKLASATSTSVNSKPTTFNFGMMTRGAYSTPLALIISIVPIDLDSPHPIARAMASGIVVTLAPVSNAIRRTCWWSPFAANTIKTTTFDWGSIWRGNRSALEGVRTTGRKVGLRMVNHNNALIGTTFPVNDITVGTVGEQLPSKRNSSSVIHFRYPNQQPLRGFIEPTSDRFEGLTYFGSPIFLDHMHLLLRRGLDGSIPDFGRQSPLYSHHQWLGMLFIYMTGFITMLIVSAWLQSPDQIFTPHEWGLKLVAFAIGGIPGHRWYNQLARKHGWARLTLEEKKMSSAEEELSLRLSEMDSKGVIALPVRDASQESIELVLLTHSLMDASRAPNQKLVVVVDPVYALRIKRKFKDRSIIVVSASRRGLLFNGILNDDLLNEALKRENKKDIALMLTPQIENASVIMHRERRSRGFRTIFLTDLVPLLRSRWRETLREILSVMAAA